MTWTVNETYNAFFVCMRYGYSSLVMGIEYSMWKLLACQMGCHTFQWSAQGVPIKNAAEDILMQQLRLSALTQQPGTDMAWTDMSDGSRGCPTAPADMAGSLGAKPVRACPET